MNKADTLFQKLLVEITEILMPIKALNTPQGITWLLREMGWELPGGAAYPGRLAGIDGRITEVEDAIQSIKDATDEMDLVFAFVGLEEALRGLVEDVYSLVGEIKTTLGAFQDFIDNSTITDTFAIRLIDYLIISYLEHYRHKVYSITVFAGLIQNKKQAANSLHPYQPEFILRKVNWDRIGDLVTKPFSPAQDFFQWGNLFDAQLFMAAAEYLMRHFRLPGGMYTQDAGIMTVLGRVKNPDDELSYKELRIPLFYGGIWPDTYGELGVNVAALPASGREGYDGISVISYLMGHTTQTFDLSKDWQADFKASASLDQGFGIKVRPGDFTLLTDINLTRGAAGSLEIGVRQKDTVDEITLFGIKGVFNLKIKGVGVKFIAVKDGKEEDIAVEIIFQEIMVEIGREADEEGGDGLLQKILPSPPLKVNFGMALGFSKNKGFYVKEAGQNGVGGNFKLEYTYNANLSLGPVNITTIIFTLQKEGSEFALIVAASADAQLGPVSAAVKGIGIKLMLEQGKPGLLGNASLGVGFKFPDGLGLSLDASVVKGGGYLEIEDGCYAGALQIDVVDTIAVTAFGILVTKLPDGRKIFSLKIFASAQFSPIQLGFGFILTGLGFAVAINCTMNVEALRTAVYTKSLDAILFPDDPIKNAPTIIANLKSFFPVQEGSFVFGAMARLGWGGATALIKAEIGIFIEVGQAFRIALAGIAHCELPVEDAAVLIIKFTVLGLLDVTGKCLSIDATLEGSKILDWPLGGDIALRAAWGDHPLFAFSAGGFYPGYKVPAGFPQLRRLSLTIGEDNPKIGFFSYMAVTENSVQFGAQVMLHFEEDIGWPVGLFEIDGDLSFDAIIRFSPFSFEAGLSATVSLKRNHKLLFGIYLKISLSGPNNYRVKGSAEFSIIGFDVSADFDETFGGTLPEPERAVLSPLGVLTEELKNDKNWSVMPLNDTGSRVIMRPGEDSEGYMDTFGSLGFRQKSIPLTQKLEKLGEAKVAPGESVMDLRALDGSSRILEDFFAPGQHEYLTDSEKISKPAFEKMKSGVAMAADLIGVHQAGGSVLAFGKELAYETKKARPKQKRKEDEPAFVKIATTAPVAPGSVDKQHYSAGQKYHNSMNVKPESDKQKTVKVKEQKFAVITGNARNGLFDSAAGGEMTYSQARQVRREAGGEVEIAASHKARQ